MKKEEYQKELERATPILKLLTSDTCSNQEAKKILMDCDLKIVNTVEILMIMGRHAQYNHRKKPYKHPIAVLKSWDDYVSGGYANTNKEHEILYVTGKVHLKSYLKTSMKLLSVT